jgi:cytochrome b6-f complex iron-sulfur subunit
MQRREFLGSLTGPVAAVCAVCLGACSKSGGSGSNNGTSTASANFTIDLGTQLLSVGSSVAANGVLIARLASGNSPSSFVAVQQACTHQGTNINYVSSNQTFLCPNHGAIFNSAGSNTGGQSTSPLKVYSVTISGSTMTVTG